MITRDYAWADGRMVHFRRAGAGRPLLLLHQSPRSSAELEPLIAALSDRYFVIAPDTPGNGLSDPLVMRDAEIEPFADALAAFLRAIGMVRCGVYGYHTGAAMAAGLAARHPDRVAFVMMNGLPAFDADERLDLITNYLPPFEPKWDGSHLTWAWARLTEQTIFFPWYRTQSWARMAFDVPPPAVLHAALIDLLSAGDRYRDAYGAAFRLHGPTIARTLTMPFAVVATPRDPLRPHLDRLTDLPESASIAEIAPGDAAVVEAIDKLSAQRADLPDVPALADARGSRFYIGSSGKQLHVRSNNPAATGRPLIVVDAYDGAGLSVQRAADAAARGRPVFAPCLPGCGESDTGEPVAPTEIANALGIADAQFCAIGRTNGEASTAASEPDRYGAYLARAWQQVRHRELFDSPAVLSSAGRRLGPAPELPQLHAYLLGALQRRSEMSRLTAVDQHDPNHWRGN